MEASLHQVEVELESVRVQLEEESEARLDLERQVVRANGEATTWKSKYETEANARAEEIEELRRKYTVRIQEQEEHIESIVVKLNNLEKQKSRLQSEVEILIIDLEKVFQNACSQNWINFFRRPTIQPGSCKNALSIWRKSTLRSNHAWTKQRTSTNNPSAMSATNKLKSNESATSWTKPESRKTSFPGRTRS